MGCSASKIADDRQLSKQHNPCNKDVKDGERDKIGKNVSNVAFGRTIRTTSAPRHPSRHHKPLKKPCRCNNLKYDSGLPYCVDIYIPFSEDTIPTFLAANEKLKNSALPCRIRFILNDFIWLGERRKRIRVEGKTKDELVKCVDLLDELCPSWKVWNNGNVPGTMEE